MFEKINANLGNVLRFSEEEIAFFNSLLEVIEVPKKTIYYHIGEINCLSFVNKGLLKSYVYTDEGKEICINFCKEDYWLADVNSFYFNEPSRFQFETIEDCELVCITHDNMNILVEKYPKFERAFHHLLKKYIINFHERYIDLLSKSARERYDLLAAKFPDYLQRIPQKNIASYLGVTPEFLSKMRGMR